MHTSRTSTGSRPSTATAQSQAAVSMLSGEWIPATIQTCGRSATHDSAARLADYDYDGIAAGVIFHGSMNMEPIPFISVGRRQVRTIVATQSSMGVGHADLQPAGSPTSCRRHHIATSGSRNVPMWDLDAAVAEVEWAHEAGLRGVNFPAMRDG